MMRIEFESKCEELGVDITSLTDDEYTLIEFIYMWYPLIDEYDGKYEMVKLYEMFGMSIFEDMKPRAEKYKELYYELREKEEEINNLKKQMAELKKY